jgi:hypothetical protein
MTISSSLDKAIEGAFTRSIPKSAGAQMRYLVKQHRGSTRDVAVLPGVSQRTVERYVRDPIKRPRDELAERMRREVTRRWQPQVRARARRAAATTSGVIIDTRARFGFTAPVGTTDDARMRHLTLALPPRHAAPPCRPALRRPGAGATDRQVRQITAEALGQVYFRDGGRRAHGLDVEYTDVEYIAFEL